MPKDSNRFYQPGTVPQNYKLPTVSTMATAIRSTKVPNELYRDLMGVSGLNPFIGNDSSPRQQMFSSSHLSQMLVISGATERYIQTGMEQEYGKYTFSQKMPCDAQIIRVIERYKPKIGAQAAINKSPETVVIYEDVHTKQIGMLSLQEYCSYHSYFGFKYKATPALANLRAGAMIPKDTILLDSPSIVQETGGYKYGIQLNMALMTHPATSEDGILICRDKLHLFGFKTYEERPVEFGEKFLPLNLYGTEDEYKPHPDIGEYIRSDGILFGLRSYDKKLAVVEQSSRALMEPDLTFDSLTYVAGPGGKVIDIIVHHEIDNVRSGTPSGMDTQPLKYDRSRREFYTELLSIYQQLYRERGTALNLSRPLHRLIVEAKSVIGDPDQRVNKIYRRTPLDDWYMTFIIEYDNTPTVGFKMTGCHGDKGVVCKIAEPHEMPVDEDGNRADIVMDPNSTLSRMNVGRLYEQYLNAASRDVAKKVRTDLGISQDTKNPERIVEAMEINEPERVNRIWEYLLGYYRTTNPKVYIWLTDGEYRAKRSQLLGTIIKEGVQLYMPPENDPELPEMVMELEKNYRPTYGPVSYVGNSGRLVKTKNPVRIGSMYILLLEKIGDDWTAVSSGKLQHFGVLSQVTNSDKYSQPTRNQAIRAWGEAEMRILASYAGTHVTAEVMDRNNNPLTHKEIVYNILKAPQPTNIQLAVDRTRIPLGGSKPLQLIKHVAQVSGFDFQYQPHQPTY